MPDILTKWEVDRHKKASAAFLELASQGSTIPTDSVLASSIHEDMIAMGRTIEAMAELLERVRSPECFDQSEYYYLWRDAAQLLATYHGTKGGDDDCK